MAVVGKRHSLLLMGLLLPLASSWTLSNETAELKQFVWAADSPGPINIINLYFTGLADGGADSARQKDYNRVKFKPDWARFKLEGMDDNHMALFTKRAYDMAGVSDRSKSVKFNGAKIAVKDSKDYTTEYKRAARRVDAETGQLVPEKIVYYNDGRWEIGIGQSDDQVFQHVSFVNSIATSKGGQHVEYITK